MKTFANVYNNTVISILHYDTLPDFHPSIVMIELKGKDKTNVTVGMTLEGGKFIPTPVTEIDTVVEQTLEVNTPDNVG